MSTQLDLDEFIPTMDTPEKVYQLFDSLGYKVLDSRLKTNPSVYNLPVREAALVEKIFAVANYDRRFQILLFKLKEENKEAIRTIPEKILREVDFPFIIFTPDFKTYTFTLVEKVREGPGDFKRKLTKLVIDTTQPYHTDKEILKSLVLSTETKNPVEVYKLFQSAFNVEKVTKKFFTEYREVFERLVSEVTKQNKHLKFTLFSRDGSVENFVKILLGRLMFLYFIQKRGWINCFDGWGSGDKKFLFNKFQEAKKDKKNYFKDYLEPLFFDTLNNPRRDKPDQATQFGGRIPFLNGGLFEPEYDYQDVRSHILLENSAFDDVFSVFEKYNFTVKEDEPLEKEVAIDPEMLGKVFENLLEENLRKGKGTYYTPREIVHYMCHESLINYLASEVNLDQDVIRNFLDREQSLEKKETFSPLIKDKAKEIDEKLADIKVLDPACGSGAFLVGMLHEVINARLNLNRELGRSLSEYELKKATIQNNIYGVDIDPGASEIAKLRLWLTLVVDHNLSEIEPLPNLDYKIMVGNSLIEDVSINGKSIKLFNYEFFIKKQGKKMKNLFEEEVQKDLFDDLHWQNIQSEVEQIIKRKKLLFNTFEFEEKQELRREINNLENELIRKSLRHEAQLLKDRIQYERQNSELKTDKQNKELLDIQFSKSFLDELINDDKKLNEYKSSNLFLWKLRFIEVFDKKEGFDVVIANPPYIQLQKNGGELADLYENEAYRTFERKGDIYCLFYEKGFGLLKDGGILAYITSNKWMRSRYGAKLRNYLSNDLNPLFLIDYGSYQNFGNATTYTNILIVEKSGNRDMLRACKIGDDYKQHVNISSYSKSKAVYLKNLSDKIWVVMDKAEQGIKDKFDYLGKPLREWDIKINYGIKTGCNEAFVINKSLVDFLLSKDQKNKEIIKPVLRGKDINKYEISFANLYLICTGYNQDIKKNYPHIFSYLEEYGKKERKLGSKGRGLFNRDDQGKNWWNLRACDYYDEFEKEKIIWKQLAVNRSFYLDTEAYYGLNSTAIISGKNVRYLIGLLNSKLVSYAYEHYYATGNMQNDTVVYWVEFIKDLPLPIDSKYKSEIENLVSKISNIKNKNQKADISKDENAIDRLVYKLYDLSPEEIKIVEENQI